MDAASPPADGLSLRLDLAKRGAWLAVGTLARLATAAPLLGQPASGTRIVVVMGIRADGRATGDWLAVLRRRLSPAEFDSVASIRRPPTDDEAAWAALLRQRTAAWEGMIAPVAELYHPVAPPRELRVVLGNRGASDAFTHDDHTIGFDLASLQAAYGAAGEPGNADRLDRFFRHETTHVLQKAWLTLHPWSDRSPLGTALWDIWAEGLGNYYSLSSTWVDGGGRLTDRARQVLADLEPELIAHLEALACADSAAAEPHLATLSSGPFTKKWGALPAALWLASETGPADIALRRFIRAGPSGVWDLVDRHVAAPLRPALREVRVAATRCSRRPR